MKSITFPVRWFLDLSLSVRIFSGLGLGVFLGLFLGESAAIFAPAGEVYIRLLQMSVVPYLVVALILAFGQMEAQQAKRLAFRAGAILLLIWALTTAVIAALPLAFPSYQSASFFSNSLVEPAQPFSFADLYFTTNPFYSLSNNMIPAVVLFSSMLGISLIKIKEKEGLLSTLRVLNQGIVGITMFAVELTPIGVLAISANAAGTTDPETLERLAVYFIAFAAASLLLTFWILPLLVRAVTPFSYWEIVHIASDALVTAFVVNNAFVVLPILVERSKQLMETHGRLNSESDSAAEVLIPILFNFPNAGRLLTLLFVPFAAWLSGDSMTAGDYTTLWFVGIPSYFAKAQVALPFLLDYFKLPADLFHLYVPTAIITGKFDSMTTAMNLLVFALLGAATMGGFLVIDGRRLLRTTLLMIAGVAATVAATSRLMSMAIDTSYHMDQVISSMHASRSAADVVAYRDLESAARSATPYDGTVLQRVKARGVLRVGYDPENLPLTFFNRDGQLVGFDVELATRLAQAMNVRAEFVPITWDALPELLRDGIIDIMPGVWYRPNWLTRVHLSVPYMTGTMGLAVRDERRHDFSSSESIRSLKGLKIGVPLDSRQIETSLERYFGGSDAQFVTLGFWETFFEGKHPELDAFIVPAENAAAWTLLHPDFAVVVPLPDPVLVPTGFAAAPGATDLIDAVNEWIVFANSTGIVDSTRSYWILGQGAKSIKPRWSIMRDVLGWAK